MALPKLTLEGLLTANDGFALTASPTQRAIGRIADGIPLRELARQRDVISAVGGELAVGALPTVMPRELYLLAAIRSGKSLIAAALALRASQICDISTLRPGETARISVLSVNLDSAKAVRDHLVGTIQARPKLRALLLEEPTADTVMLRHPTGRAIEVKIVAGSRAGGTVISRWSAGVIFDEFPRMLGSSDGVINFDDSRRSVLGRLLPGAQLFALGSPWGPFGPAYRVVQEHFGRPDHKIVVIRATGPMMNPRTWTREECERLRQADPIAYRTDVLGEFADAESSMFPTELVEAASCRKPVSLPPEANIMYGAAMDPATRGNPWTLVITKLAWSSRGAIVVVVRALQWIGSPSQPLSPRKVLSEIAAILREYNGLDVVYTDQWAADAIRDIAYEFKLCVQDITVNSQRKVELFDSLKTLLVERRVELAPVPELSNDLRRVRRVVTQHGISIDLPQTSDGRHCDFAMALAMASAVPLPMPPEPETEKKEDPADEFERKAIAWKDSEQRSATDPLDRNAMDMGDMDRRMGYA